MKAYILEMLELAGWAFGAYCYWAGWPL